MTGAASAPGRRVPPIPVHHIGPANCFRVVLMQDSSIATWWQVAKDGADLPAGSTAWSRPKRSRSHTTSNEFSYGDLRHRTIAADCADYVGQGGECYKGAKGVVNCAVEMISLQVHFIRCPLLAPGNRGDNRQSTVGKGSDL
jgi:hypothetical protein